MIDASGDVAVYIQTALEPEDAPVRGTDVFIIPKPIKSQYATTKHLIRKWTKNGDTWCPLLRVFLTSSFNENWEITMDDLRKITRQHYIHGRDGLYLGRLEGLLNSEQILNRTFMIHVNFW